MISTKVLRGMLTSLMVAQALIAAPAYSQPTDEEIGRALWDTWHRDAVSSIYELVDKMWPQFIENMRGLPEPDDPTDMELKRYLTWSASGRLMGMCRRFANRQDITFWESKAATIDLNDKASVDELLAFGHREFDAGATSGELETIPVDKRAWFCAIQLSAVREVVSEL